MRLRLKSINLTLPRRIDGERVRVPVMAGLKVGLTGEMYLLDLLRALLPDHPGAIVDVGVNIGQTLAKAKLADPARPYYGFEPNPACFAYLERFIEVNGWREVTLFPFGLGKETEVLELFSAAEKATDSEASFVPAANPHHEAGQRRHAVVFDFAAVAPLIREPAALVKVDVEGMELDVLASMRPLLEAQRPAVVLEMLTLKNMVARHAETVRLLAGLGYRVFRIETGARRRLAGLTEIAEYTHADVPLKTDYAALSERHLASLDPSLIRSLA